MKPRILKNFVSKLRKSRLPGFGYSSAFPGGHFYSPVTNPADLATREDEIWTDAPFTCHDISFNDPLHQAILAEWFPRHMGRYDYPESCEDPDRFFTRNPMFSWLDSRALFVFLLECQPRRLIEIGSGYSSLLTADVNHRFLGNAMEFSCIEPYPRDFLKKGFPGLGKLHQTRVEKTGLGIFNELEAGDILFVDSSHVSRTGSDVNFIVFEILPRLPQGVMVHFHDIFLPQEYPRQWAIDENRSWNEQYLLRALLMNSNTWEVMFGCNYAHLSHRPLVASALNTDENRALSGSSFWIRKTA